MHARLDRRTKTRLVTRSRRWPWLASFLMAGLVVMVPSVAFAQVIPPPMVTNQLCCDQTVTAGQTANFFAVVTLLGEDPTNQVSLTAFASHKVERCLCCSDPPFLQTA